MAIHEPLFQYLNYIPTEVLLIGILTVLFWWHSKQKFSYWKDRNVPYVKPLPFLGSVLDIVTTPLHDLELKRYFSLGPIYGSFEGYRPVLVVGDPNLIRDIFVKDFPTFPNRRIFRTGVRNFDLSLAVNESEDWKRIRSIITPTFTISKLKRLLGIFKECSETLVQNFKISAQKEESTSVRRFIDAFVLDVTASSIFSTKMDSFNDPKNAFVQHAIKHTGFKHKFKMSLTLLFNSWDLLGKFVKISAFDSSTFEFFSNVVKNVISERKRTEKTRDDLLQLLLETQKEADTNSKKDCVENDDDVRASYGQDIKQNTSINAYQKYLTDEELVAQCFTLYLAAHGNTSSLISFAIYLLSTNESIQENAYQEIRENLQETNGEMTYEALQKMKYLDNVISETLRLYPPSIRGVRRAEKDYKLGDTGITIQKNTIIQLPILGIHRDPKHYPNPEKFDPDRFSAEEVAKRNPNVYLPFGLGPRNCIGMRFARITSKVCLVYILSCFNIKTCSKTKVPLEFDPTSYLTFQAKDVTVKLEIRNDCPLVYN